MKPPAAWLNHSGRGAADVGTAQLHDLGKRPFGFSCFWMYSWFSQCNQPPNNGVTGLMPNGVARRMLSCIPPVRRVVETERKTLGTTAQATRPAAGASRSTMGLTTIIASPE
jgi:hypothetical protein